MGKTGCKIIYDFKRVPGEILSQFADLPVANIDDCMGRNAAIDANIRPMNKAKVLGSAFTVRVPQGDNLMFHKAMDLAKPGDVIVIDAGGGMEHAIFGELMVTYCKIRGIAGIIVDGCIRDSDAIADMDFPVYARGITPNGPYKNGPGEINVPVSIGGKVVCPGDIIAGDCDGVVIIKPEDAQALIAKTKAVIDKEAAIMDKILNEGTYIRPWVNEKLKEIDCDF